MKRRALSRDLQISLVKGFTIEIAPLTACSIVLLVLSLFTSVFLVEISMLSLCVVNDCPANFSLAVQRHTCGAHKLRIRRIGQPACLSVSIYLLFFLSACSQREAMRLHFTRLDSRAYSLPAIHHFSWRWHFHLFQQTNTSNNNNVDKSIFYGHAFLSLFHSPPLSLYLTDPSSPFVLSCAGYALSNLLVSIKIDNMKICL